MKKEKEKNGFESRLETAQSLEGTAAMLVFFFLCYEVTYPTEMVFHVAQVEWEGYMRFSVQM